MNLEDVLFYTKKLKVLYVEDDKSLLEEMKDVLEQFFLEVVIATDGEEGLKLYNDLSFDIVISDIQMPRMDGITLSKEIKQINKDQEIIIISAYNDSDKLLSLIQISISDFILKPMEFEQLLKVFYKVAKNVYLKKESENFMLAQSKMAMMGEMIDLVAHQWLQFINVLSMKTELLNMENSQNNLTTEKIDKYTKDYMKELEELTKTLKEFRSFFENKPKEKVKLKKEVDGSLFLLKDYLIKNLIEINNDIDEIEVDVYPNEFKQVILNIITNMVDNFNDRGVEDREIKIYNNKNILYIEDNGGGIDTEVIDYIFDENFTTKEYGSGKGLYLSKKIIKKIDSDILVENRENGAKFIIKIG